MDWVFFLHLGVVAFALGGWLIWPRVAAPFNAAILAHWLTNNNRCALSAAHMAEAKKNSFTQELFGLVGLPWPNANWLQNAIPYTLLGLPLLGSIWISRRGPVSREAKASHQSADSPSDGTETPTQESGPSS